MVVIWAAGLVFATVARAAEAAPDAGAVQVVEMRGMRTVFHSSVSGEPFCRLRFGALQPASARVGPFKVAQPGVELVDPELEFLTTSVSAEDWDSLLAKLASLQRSRLPQALRLTLADGRMFLVSRMPTITDRKLGFTRAQPVGQQNGPLQAIILAATGEDLSALVINTSIVPHVSPPAETNREGVAPAPASAR